MNGFTDLTLNDTEPVYQQIIHYVKIKIHLEILTDGDELPSRRELASSLGINPNTVQKAYKLLDDEGLLTTGNNVKSTLHVTDEIKQQIQKELTESTVANFIAYAKSIHLSYKDTITLLTKLWE